jgi:hypothetical protein
MWATRVGIQTQMKRKGGATCGPPGMVGGQKKTAGVNPAVS